MGVGKFLLTTPVGEEVLEGTFGGITQSGGHALLTDQDWETTGLQTLGAVAGGIGVGMAGRRIGGWAGKKIHPAALKNQNDSIAVAARLGGSKTTAEGAAQLGALGKSKVKEEILNSSTREVIEGLEKLSPEEFAAKFGMNPDEVIKAIPEVQQGLGLVKHVGNLEALGPEGAQRFLKSFLNDVAMPSKSAEKLEQVIRQRGAAILDNPDAWKKLVKENADGKALADKIPEELKQKVKASMLEAVIPPVTGEHVGRGIGRFAGDEIGILTGMGLGTAAAHQLGYE